MVGTRARVRPDEIRQIVQARRDDLVELRRDFHAHPELSFEEQRTAARVAELLEQAGLEVRTGVGRTGVRGLLRGREPGKRLLIRADMDALPIEERNDVPYRSQRPGIMHACGHDGHVAIAATVARILADLRARWRGEVVFAFQPAEETIGGAKAMLEDGLLDDRQPDASLGLHIWAPLPVGQVGVREGPLFAAADQFTIRVLGRGGHGAMPDLSIDPVPVAAQIILALQTMAAREVSPLEPVVVTVGRLRAGTAFNVIAPEAVLEGTVRTFDRGLQEQIRQRMETLVRGIAAAARAGYELDYQMPCPPLLNDPSMAALVREAAGEVLGHDHVVVPRPTMGGEDMSLILERVPGCFFLVGGASPSRRTGPHHSPDFDFDEEALVIGAQALLAAALRFLD